MVSGLTPRYGVVDDIGIDGSSAPNLDNLNPAIGYEISNRSFHRIRVTAEEIGQCLLADHHSVLMAHLGDQVMQDHCCRRAFLD